MVIAVNMSGCWACPCICGQKRKSTGRGIWGAMQHTAPGYQVHQRDTLADAWHGSLGSSRQAHLRHISSVHMLLGLMLN